MTSNSTYGMAWFEHPNVRTVVRSRSTSVGDLLQTEDGRLLQVAPFGFREIAGEKLPAQHSVLVQALRTMTSCSREAVHQKLITQVGHLYTALLFAADVLEDVSDEAPLDPDRALLARFAAEQARWALNQADGE